MAEILPVLVLLLIVVTFGCLMVFGTALLGPKLKQSKVKKSSYECGLPAEDAGDTKISIKFYLTAILFILFDIEIIFMYPWAITYTDFIDAGYGLQSLVAMGIFLFIFIVGLFWEVKSKALDWD